MRQLTAPGDLHTVTIHGVNLSAQLTTDGGVTITVWAGPDRQHAVAFSYADKALARQRYAQIRQLARTGLSPEHIDEVINGGGQHAIAQVRQILTDALAQAAADDSVAGGILAARLQEAREATETPADKARADRLAADIRAHLAAVHGAPARSFAEIRDRHAAAIEADRREVA